MSLKEGAEKVLTRRQQKWKNARDEWDPVSFSDHVAAKLVEGGARPATPYLFFMNPRPQS